MVFLAAFTTNITPVYKCDANLRGEEYVFKASLGLRKAVTSFLPSNIL